MGTKRRRHRGGSKERRPPPQGSGKMPRPPTESRNSRSGIPGIRGPPKFPAGIPGNLWNSGGNYGEFIGVLSFFPIFIVDYDILVFNLTHCIRRIRRMIGLPPFEQNLAWRLWPNFCVYIECRYTFIYWYRKITEQRQNFANSDRCSNEDAEIILIDHRPRFCIHIGLGWKVFWGDAVSGVRLSGRGERLLIQRRSIAAGQSRVSTCGSGRMESCLWHFWVDSKT